MLISVFLFVYTCGKSKHLLLCGTKTKFVGRHGKKDAEYYRYYNHGLFFKKEESMTFAVYVCLLGTHGKPHKEAPALICLGAVLADVGVEMRGPSLPSASYTTVSLLSTFYVCK